MTIFVNSTHPYLRILLPSGDYAQFQGGKLELDEDDPDYGIVLDEATRNPGIAILVNETTCRFCGESFTGSHAGEKLADHKKDNHFDLWVKETELEQATFIQKEIKARAGYACDICAPVQTFGTSDDLAEHFNTLHASAPDLDDEGNTLGGSDDGRRPGEVAPRAARASTKNR